MTNNPKSKIDNPKSIDPALSEHLDELAALAREIGAEEVTIIRGPVAAGLGLEFVSKKNGVTWREYIPLSSLNKGHLAYDTGLLVVLRFPQSDGGGAGVEVK